MRSLDLNLKRLVIENYKSIRHLEIDDLPNLSLFLGRNNSGKSNLLDAIQFVADASTGFAHALAHRGGNFREVTHRKKLAGKISFTFDFGLPPSPRAHLIERLFADNKLVTPDAAISSGFLCSLRLRLAIGPDEFSEELSISSLSKGDWFSVFSVNGLPGVTEAFSGQLESLCQNCGGALAPQPVSIAPSASEPYRLHLGNPAPGPDQHISEELAESVRQQFIGLRRIDSLRQPAASAPISATHELAADASNLPAVLHWLYENQPRQFHRVEAEVAKIIPDLGRLFTPATDNTASLGLIDSSGEELVYSSAQMSHGVRSLLSLVTAVILAPPGAWICLDAPAMWLHFQAQAALYRFLREESASKRIFVATHSAAFAGPSPISSLFLIARDHSNDTVAKPVTGANVSEVIAQWGIPASFNVNAEAVVFVEDGRLVAALEGWAQKFPFQITVQFLPAEGGSTLHCHANLAVALGKFVNSVVFAILCPGHDPARSNLIDRLALPAERILILDSASPSEAMPEAVRLFFEKIAAESKPHWLI
jgi:predicted ATPase